MNPWIRSSWRIALRRSVRWWRLALLTGMAALLGTCSFPVSELERLQELGRLRVVSRNAATSFYLAAEGRPVGVDYELAEGFAQRLGLTLEFIPLENVGDLLPSVQEGLADIAAAHITATQERAELVRFGPAYQQVSTFVVYKRGKRRPRSVDDLAAGRLAVIADSSHLERLQALREEYPNLQWEELPLASVEELFEAVEEGDFDFAVADSSAYQLNRRYFPEVRRGFTLADPEPIAWAFPPGHDRSILDEAQRYFLELRLSGELQRIIDRYYSHTDSFDWVGTRTFLRHIESRLPRYEPLFRQAAEEVGLDWHLLAATAYQESHWDKNAVSPTRVRGLMMLTEATASQLGVDDRTSPEQSILGGARYLVQMRDRLDPEIREPDRTWLALAAYNVGYGHLQDARTLTQMHDRDPNLWTDVREHLPLLTRRRWYSQVPRGYARGRQPVEYVRNIRSYYDILLWKAPDVELTVAPEEEASLAQSEGGGPEEAVTTTTEVAETSTAPAEAPAASATDEDAPTGELVAPEATDQEPEAQAAPPDDDTVTATPNM
ncbi:MAG: membrane-bound lytic murein transglycosylase MltF [Pseudomonadota bacterium]